MFYLKKRDGTFLKRLKWGRRHHTTLHINLVNANAKKNFIILKLKSHVYCKNRL